MGTVLAGAVYVPLGYGTPRERLRFVLEDAQPAVILVHRELLDTLPPTTARIVLLDELQLQAASPVLRPQSSGLSPESAAYLIYTSGSTGEPKGAVITHQGLANMALGEIAACGITAEDRILQFSTVSFDASVWEIFGALAGGARLVETELANLMPGPEFVEFLEAAQVTMVTVPPSTLAVLPVNRMPHLKTVISAGEALPGELARKWAGRGRMPRACAPASGGRANGVKSAFARVLHDGRHSLPGRPTGAFAVPSRQAPARAALTRRTVSLSRIKTSRVQAGFAPEGPTFNGWAGRCRPEFRSGFGAS